MQAFPDQPGLLRNMMGLLGNVAEVEELRPQLMTTQFVSVFSELLYSPSDGIEVTTVRPGFQRVITRYAAN